MSWFGNWDGFDEEMQNAPDIFARKPQTNADRIRAMGDEELASLLNEITDPDCPPAHGYEYCKVGACQKCWLNWLKQEVKE